MYNKHIYAVILTHFVHNETKNKKYKYVKNARLPV